MNTNVNANANANANAKWQWSMSDNVNDSVECGSIRRRRPRRRFDVVAVVNVVVDVVVDFLCLSLLLTNHDVNTPV